jgi:hypothetical protein
MEVKVQIPKNCVATDISYMILRRFNEFHQLLMADDISLTCSLDFFSVYISDLSRRYLRKRCVAMNCRVTPNAYEKATMYRTSDFGRFILFEDCKHESRWPYKVQLINAKNYRSLIEISQALERIMGKVNNRNHQLARIDPAFVFAEEDLSPRVLFASTHLPWKNSNSAYNNQHRNFKDGRLTGFHSNGSGVRPSVYAESAKPKCEDAEFNFIKFEYQLKKTVLESRNLFTIYDLHRLAEYNLIRRAAFYNPLWIQRRHKHHLDKFKLLQEILYADGFHNARKSLNRHRNFNRDYKGILLPLRIKNGEVNLSDVFANKFSKWLKEWCDGLVMPPPASMTWKNLWLPRTPSRRW